MQLPKSKPTKTFSSSSQKTKECFFSKGKTNQRNLIVSNYSYPEHAVVRELVANARDAHIAAKQTRPIELTIKNNGDHRYNSRGFHYVIRDFGNGVSKDYLDTKWCEIGHSTKSSSNDQVGAFGIGRMTPFCVAESFTVTSYQNGEAHSYIMSENENGIFQNTYLGTRKTSEPDGLRIEFTANKGHVDEDAMHNVRYIDVPIKIKINEKEYKTRKFTDFSWNGPGYAFADQQIVIYGGIAYPSPVRNYSGSYSLPFILDIPLGKLEIASSRERLSSTDENSKVVIEYYEKARKHMFNSIQTKLDACASRKEAFKMVYDLGYHLNRNTTYKYKGEPLPLETKNKWQSYSTDYKGTCYDDKVYNIRIEPDNLNAILVDDPKYSARNHIKAHNLTGRIVVAKNVSLADLAKELCLDEEDILLSSSLVEKTKQYLKEKRKNRQTGQGLSMAGARYFQYSGKFESQYVKQHLTPVSEPEEYLVCMDKYEIQNRRLLSLYKQIATPPDFTVVRSAVYQKLIDSGKHKPLYKEAKNEIRRQAKPILHHMKRDYVYRSDGKVLRFLKEECKWTKLGSILDRLVKSKEICASKRDIVNAYWYIDTEGVEVNLDLGIADLLPYHLTGIKDSQKRDLQDLYKAKYKERSK